jgi:signal transduction histidine kinase
MVVEDERVVALHLKQQLMRLGYRVPLMATSGEKALLHLKDARPDVVLMDVHLEGALDGIATAQQIPPELQIPIIYLTAYSEEATLDRARATRPYGYLIKPFSERELHASIQMVLERRRADAAQRESEQRLAQIVAERTAELAAETALRIQAERELHETQKMEALGQLTGGIAHDFNNLLTVIIGSLSRIERRPDLPAEEIRRSTGAALRASQRAATLTHRLLAYSRRQPLDPKSIDPNHLVATTCDTLRRTLSESVTIKCVLASAPWPVLADPSQLESAILNLALNARDAMPGHGTLTIETSNVTLDAEQCAAGKDLVAGEYVVVAVRDTGVGMSQEVKDKAFEPFFTTKDFGQGTGLGLSQVYGFMKQSGGHVLIESAPGAGTTVSLYLPRMTGSGLAPLAPEEPRPLPMGSSAETILVVEDDQQVRANAVELLRELGYHVVEAADGNTAIEILKGKTAVALLFTDVGLPGGMNGKQVADAARRFRPGLRVLFTTGYARDAIVHHGRLDPGIDLLPKPFTFGALAAKIRSTLDGQ